MLDTLVLEAAGVPIVAALHQLYQVLRSELRPDFRESQLLQTRRAALGISLVRLRAGRPITARPSPLYTRLGACTRHRLPMRWLPAAAAIVAPMSPGILSGYPPSGKARGRLQASGVGARGVGAGLRLAARLAAVVAARGAADLNRPLACVARSVAPHVMRAGFRRRPRCPPRLLACLYCRSALTRAVASSSTTTAAVAAAAAAAAAAAGSCVHLWRLVRF
jgi:hypothetical protein